MSDADETIIKNSEPKEESVVTKILRGIYNVVTKTNVFVGHAMSYTLLILLLLMVVEVFRRYVLHNQSVWGFDLGLWIFGMPALLAGGWVLYERGHVNMDMVYNKFSARGKAILDCITSIVFFAFIWIMLTQSLKAAGLAISRNEMSITGWRVIIWPIKIWMPVAAGLTLVQGIAEFIKNLYMAITGRSLIK